MGSIKLDLSGGYNYYVSWFDSDGNSLSGSDSGIDNLEPGQYTAVFESQTCTFTKNYLVPDNNLTYSTISFDNPDCYISDHNGQIEIYVDSETQYDVIWYNSSNGYPTGGPIGYGELLSDLGEGEYIAVISNGGCTIMTREYRLVCCTKYDKEGQPHGTLPFPQFTSLTSSWVSASGVCDGSINFTTNQPNYITTIITIVMSSTNTPVYSLNNLCEGMYCLTIDNGCDTYTECIEVKSCATVNIQITGQITNTCQGVTYGRILTTVTGGEAPYKYSWSNGKTTSTIDKLSVGQYCLTVTDAHGCKGISCFTVGLNSFTFQGQTIPCGTNKYCNGEFVSFAPYNGNLSCFYDDPFDCTRVNCYCPLTGGYVTGYNNPYLSYRYDWTNCKLDGLCPDGSGWDVAEYGYYDSWYQYVQICANCWQCYYIKACFINGYYVIVEAYAVGDSNCGGGGPGVQSTNQYSLKSSIRLNELNFLLKRDSVVNKSSTLLIPEGLSDTLFIEDYSTIFAEMRIEKDNISVYPFSKEKEITEINCAAKDCSSNNTLASRSINTTEQKNIYINISPNPFTEFVEIENNINWNKGNHFKVEIVSMLGQIVFENDMTSNKTLINTEELASGVYFLRIISNSQIIETKKIIKQ